MHSPETPPVLVSVSNVNLDSVGNAGNLLTDHYKNKEEIDISKLPYKREIMV